MTVLEGVGLAGGIGEGEALVTAAGIAFNLGVDEATGTVIESGHPLAGECVAGRVVVFPSGRGSSAGSFSLLQMAARGVAPAAIVNVQADAVVTAGCVLADIPLVHRLGPPADGLRTGDRLRVDGGRGTVEILA